MGLLRERPDSPDQDKQQISLACGRNQSVNRGCTMITPDSLINIANCFSEEPQPLDFVTPGFLVGTVGCQAAAGSTGKSFFGLEMIMSVCSADADKSLLNLGIKHHGRAVLLNAEDPETIIRQRLHSIGSYLSPSAREEVAEKMTIAPLVGRQTNILDLRWQEAVLRVSEGSRLIIFDTLTRWHQVDENSNGEMSKVLSVFEMVCRETGAAVLLLHHVSKSMGRDGRQDEQQATRGAAAITDNCRWQGWMQTMSKADAEKFGIAEQDRKKFVATGGNKENYGQATGERWLERGRGGVLLPVELREAGQPQQRRKYG
jgi:RecA-family ATPase